MIPVPPWIIFATASIASSSVYKEEPFIVNVLFPSSSTNVIPVPPTKKSAIVSWASSLVYSAEPFIVKVLASSSSTIDMPVPATKKSATLSSTLSFVMYKLLDPSATSSVSKLCGFPEVKRECVYAEFQLLSLYPLPVRVPATTKFPLSVILTSPPNVLIPSTSNSVVGDTTPTPTRPFPKEISWVSSPLLVTAVAFQDICSSPPTNKVESEIYKSFHCLSAEPKDLVSSPSGIKSLSIAPAQDNKETLSTLANPTCVLSTEWGLSVAPECVVNAVAVAMSASAKVLFIHLSVA